MQLVFHGDSGPLRTSHRDICTRRCTVLEMAGLCQPSLLQPILWGARCVIQYVQCNLWHFLITGSFVDTGGKARVKNSRGLCGAKTWKVYGCHQNLSVKRQHTPVLKSRQQPIWTAHDAHKLLHSTCNLRQRMAVQNSNKRVTWRNGIIHLKTMKRLCCFLCNSLEDTWRQFGLLAQRQSLSSIYIIYQNLSCVGPYFTESNSIDSMCFSWFDQILAGKRSTTPVVPWPEKMRASSWVA